MEELLQAPVNRLQQAIQSLCVPLLHPLQASEDAVAFQRRQLFRAVKLYANVGKWHPVAPRVLAPLALGGLLEGCIAPALGNRLELQDDGRALLETVGTLETLLAATPPTLLLEKSAPQLKQTIALLDRIGQHQQQQQQQAVAAPVLSTITRLRAGFGNGGSKKSN